MKTMRSLSMGAAAGLVLALAVLTDLPQKLMAQVNPSPITMVPSGQSCVGATGTVYSPKTGSQIVAYQDIPACTAAGWLHRGAYFQLGGTFTIASGCGTTGTPLGGLYAGTFAAGAVTSCAPVINLPTAKNGNWCVFEDLTHPSDAFVPGAATTTTCSATATITAGDTIRVHSGSF